MDDLNSANTPECIKKNATGAKIMTIWGILFLLILIVIFGKIVYHFSQFESGSRFVLHVEETDTISTDGGEFEYQRLLVRNRYPFVLMLTTRLCRIENDGKQPKFFVIREQQETLTGQRSWYSGTYELTFSIAASNDGRFCVSSATLASEDLMDGPLPQNTDFSDDESFHLPGVLPEELVSSLTKAFKEEKFSRLNEVSDAPKIRHTKDKYLFFALPGDHADKVLVVTLLPLANYKK